MTALHAGASLERYRIVRPLGQGGMAMVFEVVHLDLGTTHALKVLQLHGPGLHRRLLGEGRIQAQLRNRNVCRVTDVIWVGEAPGLVMELVDGPPLETLLANYQPNLQQVDHLARGIIAGVRAAHAAGLVHRDLKPANVLIDVQDGVVPKVADFGLAKALDDTLDVGGKGTTRSGTTMGTPCYMAPEQFRDAKRADQRADVFSIGCMLYELVAGMRPFDGETPIDVYQRTSTGAYRPLRDVAPNVPSRMAAAVARALAPDPNDRLPDCDALLATWTDGVGDGAVAGAWEPAHLTLLRSFGRAAIERSSVSMLAAEPTGAPPAPAPAPAPRALPTAVPTPGAAESAGSAGSRRSPMPALPTPPRPAARPTAFTAFTARRLVGVGVGAMIASFSFGAGLLVLAAALVGAYHRPGRPVPAPIAAPSPVPSPVAAPSLDPEPHPEPDALPTPSPAPEPAPEPTATPSPSPSPAPTASPAPRPTASPEGAAIEVDGHRARLVGPGGARFDAGPVPPGTYAVYVFFHPATPTRVLEASPGPGDRVHVTCSDLQKVCLCAPEALCKPATSSP